MIGYFNVPNFCDIYSFKYPIKEPTHYEYSMNVKCIDFMLTDRLRCFQSICEIEKRLSDFYKINATVLKSYVKKKNRNESQFLGGLQQDLPMINLNPVYTQKAMETTLMSTLWTHSWQIARGQLIRL